MVVGFGRKTVIIPVINQMQNGTKRNESSVPTEVVDCGWQSALLYFSSGTPRVVVAGDDEDDCGAGKQEPDVSYGLGLVLNLQLDSYRDMVIWWCRHSL